MSHCLVAVSDYQLTFQLFASSVDATHYSSMTLEASWGMFALVTSIIRDPHCGRLYGVYPSSSGSVDLMLEAIL